MAETIGPRDVELREELERQITHMETAKAICDEAAKVDEPISDGDPLAAVLTSDVLQFIGDEMAAGRITKEVIYFIARYSVHEIEERLRQIREKKRWDASERGKHPRRKKWADELAAALVQTHKSFPAAWESIPEDDGFARRYAGCEVWRDGNQLRASGLNGDDDLGRESFRTGYFSPKHNT